MDTILVVGVESAVGANIAASYTGRYRVIGLTSARTPMAIDGCEIRYCPADDSNTIRNWAAAVRPDWIILCGPASESTWSRSDLPGLEPNSASRAWAQAASEFNGRLTVISSDAVFTGPWVFHAEDCPSRCPTAPAQAIAAMEREVAENCAHAMIVRTNVFGWSPRAAAPGWIERLLEGLESGSVTSQDCVRHATPILATDLAEILERAYRRGLEGTWHIAGAERINPAQFALRLADEFGLPYPPSPPVSSLLERPQGFGCGETSLQTSKIRRALGIPLPMVSEGLRRLHEQCENGFRDRLNPAPLPLHQKVA